MRAGRTASDGTGVPSLWIEVAGYEIYYEPGGKPYAAYVFRIVSPKVSWTVPPRRYSEALELHRELQRSGVQAAVSAAPLFPRRQMVQSTSKRVVRQRSEAFRQYFQRLLSDKQACQHAALRGFLALTVWQTLAVNDADLLDFLARIDTAAVHAKNRDGKTPLEVAVSRGLADCVATLLANGADASKASDAGYTAMHECAAKGYEAIFQMLLDAGAPVDVLSTTTRLTPLHAAVRKGCAAVARIALAHGASTEAVDHRLRTPLLAAIVRGRHQCVSLLLEHGASVAARSDDGAAALHTAAALGDAQSLSLCLAAPGSSTDIPGPFGATPLCFACKAGKLAAVLELLAAGASCTIRDMRSRTVLHYAASSEDHRGAASCVEYIFNAPNSGLLDLNACDDSGSTALHDAAVHGNVHVGRVLVEAGASCNVEDGLGATPLALASAKGNAEFVALLQSYAATAERAKSVRARATFTSKCWGWGTGVDGRLGTGDENDAPTPVLITALQGVHVAAIACGAQFSIARASNGELFSWGYGGTGRLGTGDSKTYLLPSRISRAVDQQRFVSVACGQFHSIAASSDGRVYTWGGGDFGVLGHGGEQAELLPRWIESLAHCRIVRVACGSTHSVALRDDGSVFAWGSGRDGRLGTGGESTTRYPTQVKLAKPVSEVACGEAHTLFLAADGSLFACGRGRDGALGTGSREAELTPVASCRPAGLHAGNRAIGIACGTRFSVVWTVAGSVYTCGDNSAGQLARSDGDTCLFGAAAALSRYVIRKCACGHSFAAAIGVHRESMDSRRLSLDDTAVAERAQLVRELSEAGDVGPRPFYAVEWGERPGCSQAIVREVLKLQPHTHVRSINCGTSHVMLAALV